MIICFTGNGKGKTTSAIGQGVRVVGRGEKVVMFQFIKSLSYPSGEDESLKLFGDSFELVKGGKGFVGIMNDNFPIEEHKKAAQETLNLAKKAIKSKKYGLVILDEINVALNLNLLDEKEVLNLLNGAKKDVNIVLTGRNAPMSVIKLSDTVTGFGEVKHCFNEGGKAKKGVEF